ncbi:MAG TPA: LUD domain-containing protein [Methylomusa anaerophila]|uniref:Lactate utilization protein B n=1 Tax=Methylomusa anaerophila TaxID=1930071 RepID=A0A348AFR3_9FIRM|nr:LUD domain-containing protein [Methylomusa anaerophila]BBB89911.1 lactate utilization protein B [Methylomusa anaerophila]HML90571.1 LUD domain-containing protein [Methylomusa anaerophila]
MEANDRNIKNEIHEKLSDEVLRGALGRFAEAYPVARAKAYENVEDIDALREQVRRMKAGAVADIDKLADRFEAEAVKRGARVFRAKDGAALKKYLLDLCREKGVNRIVKSKSMAAEEIHLNRDLEADGLQVKETDLGEWIISLAGQKPSHMVMPAIHLNRQQIAGYFSQELKQEIPTDIPFMVEAARTRLRQEFLQADMGISGANFGIAENGAIGLVTNEGNARLVTTLPRIHVVIIGYEKLIPTIKDAAPILRTLPRNATGQLMTSYMSMVAGVTPIMVRKNGKWVEEDKELHIILFDNGRLNAARDDKFKQIYQCVRCASCLNVCPVYTLVGGHVYGHIYAGGIGAILTAFLNSMGDFEKFNELCIGCRKCVEICPGKIDIPGLIEELRARAVKEHGLPFAVSTVFENVISNRRVFHTFLRLASIGQKPFQTGRLIRHLPLFMAGMTKDRSLPAIAAEPLRDRIPKITAQVTKPVKRVAFFCGCNIDFVFPETGESVYKVLQDLNMEVVFPDEQSCCGKPVLGMGDRETGRKIAKQNIAAFEAAAPDVIVAACPTCAETWHQTYGELFTDDPAWKKRAEKIAHKVREFTSFVAGCYRQAGRLKQVDGPTAVTYHDSCHIKRGLGIYREPRELLAAASAYQLVEMKDCDKCCGMAGAFGIKYAELSMPILKQKITNIIDSGAAVVAVACPACMMQIQGGLDKQAPHIKIKHVADILAEKV